MEWVGSVFTAVINAGWKIYLAALLASAALLFLPDGFVRQLGLEELRQTYRMYAGVVLVVSASLLSVALISALTKAAMRPWKDRQFQRLVRERLEQLTEAEKEFLRPYIVENENSIYAPISDGITGGLVAKQIIYRSSQVSHGFNFPYNLQPLVRTILTQHPELLE
ncbi:superinfection exclusion B family protein [Bradyrhizobium mercantei]|uniref:superinfection exclusion B family protein n=1 Tax=Bradyrhizobium mercantei TaxID=1904807 RepID=UPI0009756E93|nr:superinfection exclusion B family protein [Bradyrhizobium mercantei]